MEVRELEWSLLSWSTAALPRVRRFETRSARLSIRQCKLYKRGTSCAPGPRKRAFSQYVMKTHMRVALYNDRRTFWKAVTDGMKHTADYSKCWDDALGLATNESAHGVAWTERKITLSFRPVRPSTSTGTSSSLR